MSRPPTLSSVICQLPVKVGAGEPPLVPGLPAPPHPDRQSAAKRGAIKISRANTEVSPTGILQTDGPVIPFGGGRNDTTTHCATEAYFKCLRCAKSLDNGSGGFASAAV